MKREKKKKREEKKEREKKKRQEKAKPYSKRTAEISDRIPFTQSGFTSVL